MTAAQVRLRLMETSDLHMCICPYDYYRNQPDESGGLARLATAIRAARAEVPNSLLFDNGDLLQGGPPGDYVAQPGCLDPVAGHPMIRAMNALGYDAAAPGNHEFNYGLTFLKNALSGAHFPFVCSNLFPVSGGCFFPRTVVLERTVTDQGGQPHALRIGVAGFIPPQTLRWDAMHLAGHVEIGDMVSTAQAIVPELRKQCDLVVVLCHAGIEAGPPKGNDENAALHLAAVPGVDVVMTGHTHRVFPGPDYDGVPGVDAHAGTLAGKPAVMPGARGSHLGIIDLTLVHQPEGWSVSDFHCAVRPVTVRRQGKLTALVPPDAGIMELVRPEEEATLTWLAEQVGVTERPLTTWFTFLEPDACLTLINAAQTAAVATAISNAGLPELPLLSAAAPFSSGGLEPDAFVDIPAGPVTLRDMTSLYPFANTLCVVRCSGAELREWLERAASLFRTVTPGEPAPQPLLTPGMPGYNFDVISGLRWEIDLTAAARYDADGMLTDPSAHRIRNLHFQGEPVDPEQMFYVATNNYRASGGGNFPGTGTDHIVLTPGEMNRAALVQYMRDNSPVCPVPEPSWRFADPGAPVTVYVDLPARAAAAEHGSALFLIGDGADGSVRFGRRLH